MKLPRIILGLFFAFPPAAPALLVVALLLLTAASFLAVLPYGLPELLDPLANGLFGVVVMTLYTVLLPPSLLRFALVFPRPSERARRRPSFTYLPYAVGLAALPGFILRRMVIPKNRLIFH